MSNWTEHDVAIATRRMAKKPTKRIAGREVEPASEPLNATVGRRYSFTVFGKAEPGGSKQAFVPLHPTKVCICGPIPGKLPYRREGGGIMVSVTDANKNVDKWKKHVAKVANEEYGGPCFTEPIAVQFVFYRLRPESHYGKTGLNKQGRDNPFPGTKPDVLKLSRALEDSLIGLCYVDDALIVKETIEKRYGEPARVEISIEALSVETGQTSLLEVSETQPPWEGK
jgi:Holliday junction resolvase RusA-like endonuclease